MRTLTLIIAVAGAYTLLRGWHSAPALLLRVCLAVAALVAGLAVWGIRKDPTHPRMLSLRRATWLDYLTLGIAIVFTEACFVVFTLTLMTPAQEMATTFQQTIADPHKTGDEKNGNEPSPDGEISGDWRFTQEIERSLSSNSNYKPSNKPEVFLELKNTQDVTTLLNSRIHLRSFAFSRFDGLSWSAPHIPKHKLTAPITFPRPDIPNAPADIHYRIYHGTNPAGQNLFTALHGTSTTSLTHLTRLRESIHQLPELKSHTTGYTYNATSSSIHFTDLIGKPITAAHSQPHDLDLPPELAAQLRTTADTFINEPDLASQLVALRSYLQDNYTYSLKTTNPTGANPLENFLYREKRGYCEHFATAASLLCRALGVPSRIAYGWSGGRLYKAQNMFVFRAKDAHAWTEIKLERYGWVVFDTTPPDDEATPETHAAPEGEKAPDPMATIASQQHPAPPSSPTNSTAINIPPLALYSALGIIGICCAAFLLTRNFSHPATAPDGHPITTPPPSYLIHFKQTCATLGTPMPTGRTLRQQIRLLEKNNTSPSFAHNLLEYHYSIIYSGNPKNSSTEKHLTHAIRKWKKSLAHLDKA